MKRQEKVMMLREMYPEGTIIELIHMDDTQAPPDGTKGTVKYVDDIGNIHLRWETGSGLSLIPGVDRFKVLKRGGVS